jgi:hypothetical protein
LPFQLKKNHFAFFRKVKTIPITMVYHKGFTSDVTRAMLLDPSEHIINI